MKILKAGRGRAIPPDQSVVGQREIEPIEDNHVTHLSVDQFENRPPDASYTMCGAGAFLSYRAGTHGEEFRKLSVSRIERRNGQVYLFAYCHVAGGPRLFRADQIIHISDPSTGEIFNEIEDWLRSVEREEFSLLKAFYHDLVLMAYLARADGKVCENEIDRLEIYLDHLSIDNDLHMPGRESIERNIRRLAPEWIAASRACNSIRIQPGRAGKFWRALGALVDADGVLHENEHALLLEVKDALKV